jgi:transcriptional regulator with XRE-family HTH domain
MKVIQPKSLFGRRLREARLRTGIPQDKLGVSIGLDEASASARISRYKSEIHAPPFKLVVILNEFSYLPFSQAVLG